MTRERHVVVLMVRVLLASAAFVAVHPAYAFNEPDGFGRAKFGMHVEQIKKLYPDMKATILPPTPKAGDTTLQLPIVAYAVDKQHVGPLRQCNVEFRFFQSELFEIQFRCPDKERVTRYLMERFGDPKAGAPSSVLWEGKKVSVTHVPAGGTFAFGDMERTRQESLNLMALIALIRSRTPAAEAPAAQTPAVQAVALPTPTAAPDAARALVDERYLHHLSVLADGDPDDGTAPLKVHFTVTLFEEVDELVKPKFSWDFDDDSPRSHDREPTHVFKKPGTYKVRLNVTDANDKRGAVEVRIDVDAPEPNGGATGQPAASKTPAAKPPSRPAQ